MSFLVAEIGVIPTLNMQSSSAMSQGIFSPWYALATGLASLILVMLIVEIVKKYKINFKGKLW